MSEVTEQAQLLLSKVQLLDEEALKKLLFIQPKILNARVGAKNNLLKRREQYRHPKDKDITDFDRKIMLDAAVADLEARFELLKGLEELIQERVIIYKLLMEI